MLPMLSLSLNAMDFMPPLSSNIPYLPSLCCAYTPPPALMSVCLQPPSGQGSHHPRGPVSSRTRSRSGTGSGQGSHPLPDDDVVIYRDRLNTDGDPEFDPRAVAQELEGRRISPIGSRRGQCKTTCPSSPAWSHSAYFPPPGLVKGKPPSVLPECPTSRAASAPPSMYQQLLYSTSCKSFEHGPEDWIERGLAHMSLKEFEDKFVSMSQIRKLPEDKAKDKDKRPNPWDKSGPFNRKVGDILRERPYFGCVLLPSPSLSTRHLLTSGSPLVPRSYTCPIECPGSRCANCTFLRFGGNLLAAKIGQRTTNARLLRVTPRSDWPYVEDKRRVLALRESYRRGSERALAELSVLN